MLDKNRSEQTGSWCFLPYAPIFWDPSLSRNICSCLLHHAGGSYKVKLKVFRNFIKFEIKMNAVQPAFPEN